MIIFTILFLILLIILILLIDYLVFRQITTPNVLINNKNNISDKKIVLLKTHIWTDDLEKFAIKLKNETLIHGIDFFILMHSNNNKLINKIKNEELKKYILMFNENDIKKMYVKGFYSMWLSNHWILMWFYKKYKHKYKYFWTIEYDVRISGDSSKIWTYSGTEDFIYPIEIFQDPNWGFKNYYIGNKLTDNDKYYGYLQLARYSNKFLEYLNQCYTSGENGQDELITFSLFKRANMLGHLTGTKDPLNKLIKNSWSVSGNDSDKHKKLLEESETEYKSNINHVRIFHPIK